MKISEYSIFVLNQVILVFLVKMPYLIILIGYYNKAYYLKVEYCFWLLKYDSNIR